MIVFKIQGLYYTVFQIYISLLNFIITLFVCKQQQITSMIMNNEHFMYCIHKKADKYSIIWSTFCKLRPFFTIIKSNCLMFIYGLGTL